MAESTSANQYFDFVICGGGTAGLVLAARLSENKDITVCVVEAGESKIGDGKVEKPSGVGQMLGNSDYDWNYKSIPQRGANGRTFHSPRGKMLGGSSGLNFMAYGRPSREDFDYWSSALGLNGWSWADLLPYFMKSQDLQLPANAAQNKSKFPIEMSCHGTSGPIKTSFSVWKVPFEDTLQKGLQTTYPGDSQDDPCSGKHLGFARMLCTIDRTGSPTRTYSASSYLVPVVERPNLTVLTGCMVDKVEFDQLSGGLKANGVQLVQDSTKKRLKAKKEVILCAGSMHSPAILERSGVGDPKVLRKANIDCIYPLQGVGSNLQEKTLSAVVYELAPDLMSLDSFSKDPALFKEHLRMLAEEKTGALSGAVNLAGYVSYAKIVSQDTLQGTVDTIHTGSEQLVLKKERDIDSERRRRDFVASRMEDGKGVEVQIVGTPATFNIAKGYNDCAKLLSGSVPGFDACYSLVVSNMYPLSRGSVHISSKSPFSEPVLDLGLFSDDADVDVMAAGLKFADKIFNAEIIRGKVRRRCEPESTVDLSNIAQAREYVRGHVTSYHHALGTCAMGTVVDEHLRVRGVDNLRVVDASIMPTQVSAAIMSTVYAIAEKGADMIKDDWGLAERPIGLRNGS